MAPEPPNPKKHVTFDVRLTEDEKERFRAACGPAPMSVILRDLALCYVEACDALRHRPNQVRDLFREFPPGQGESRPMP